MKGLDVPHEQFVAIQNKAEYLIVEDRDKGGCIFSTEQKKFLKKNQKKKLKN